MMCVKRDKTSEQHVTDAAFHTSELTNWVKGGGVDVPHLCSCTEIVNVTT